MQSPTMQSRGEFFAPALALTTETVLTSGAPPSSDRVVVQIASARCIRSSPRRVHVGLARCSLEPLGIAGGGNDVSSLRAGAAGGLEADSGAGVSVRATRFSSGSGRRELTGGPCSIAESHRLALGVSAARAGRCSPGSAPPRGHNDLDVVAAGIWLSIGELCAGCLQLPSGVGYEARSASRRGDCG